MFRPIFSAFVSLLIITLSFPCVAEDNDFDNQDIPQTPFHIVGFGDSLMAGYRLPSDQSFTAQLEDQLRSKGYDVTITNAGVSGDTTAGGRDRIDWSVPDDTDLVILELGANDMLRGINPELTKQNLAFMLDRLRQRHKPVILIGMLSAANYGEKRKQAFDAIFKDLAKDYKVTFYPFFLDGVNGNRKLELEDAMHPNVTGVSVMVNKFLPTIEGELSRLGVKRSTDEQKP